MKTTITAIIALALCSCVTTTTTAPDGTETTTQGVDAGGLALAGELAKGYQRRKELEITHGK